MKRIISLLVLTFMLISIMPSFVLAGGENIVATLYKDNVAIGSYTSIVSATDAYNAQGTGEYVIKIKAGEYTTDCITVVQKASNTNETPKHLTIKPAGNNGSVTLKSSGANSCYYIFKVDGKSQENTDNSLLIEGIKFDISGSSGGAALYCGTGESSRYAHNINIKYCEAIGNKNENSYFVYTDSHTSASCLSIENCKVSDFGYVVNGYFCYKNGYGSETDLFGIKAKNTIANNVKCFINNQMGENSSVYIDSCKVDFYHDYAIRCKNGILDVKNSTFNSTYNKTGVGGILVMRNTEGTKEIKVFNCTFNKATNTMFDTFNDQSAETTIKYGDTVMATLNSANTYCYNFPTVTMDDYAYNSAPSNPSTPIVSDTNVNYYYSASSFLYNNNTGDEWKNITSTTLLPGTYYMRAIYKKSGSDFYTTPQTTFKVTKGVGIPPTAPTVVGNTVTIAQADITKNLEYSVDSASNWVTVPELTNGTFNFSGLSSGDHIIYLRTAENSLYNASSYVTTNFNITNYSVSYNANYGTGTVPASQNATLPATITVGNASGISRYGYTFKTWNTTSSGSGINYAPGSTISVGAILYAKWTANDYSVIFNGSGGSGNMNNEIFVYDIAKQLTANGFTKVGYTFAGWATRENGPVVYVDKQNVMNLTDSGTLTLYAVWTQNTGTIKSTINTDSTDPMTIEIKKGNTVIASQTITEFGSEPYTVNPSFSNIPYGSYNLVVTQNNVVVTQLIVDSANKALEITMPDSNVNSLLEVKEDTKPVVVGGLNKEAESKAEEAKNVYVVMTVEKEEEKELPETAPIEEKKAQTAIEAINEKVEEVQAKTEKLVACEYFNITVDKYVSDGTLTTEQIKVTTPTEIITKTNNVLEIIIPYDLQNKENVKIYRYHGDVAEVFTPLEFKPTDPKDQTYYVDKTNNLIYIYAQKFSTYGISYTDVTKDKPAEETTNVTGAADSSAIATDKALPVIYVGEHNSIIVYVDEDLYEVNNSTSEAIAKIFIENGRTFLGVRDMAYALGIDPMAIKWDDKTKTATISRSGANVAITQGSDIIKVTYGGYVYSVKTDASAKIKNDRIYLPFRVIFQIFGYTVNWDGETRTITCK